ncbi:hypothetical protein HOLleu_05302 [Holothuria leucospilota]|uniref:SAP domain-containing protein n=1 Tax=Holothuria leucospilota TaxID=206669 RepID=A0A9Q1CKT8_HOLLE|nr:hypothetical protein HOLleu_05302 [Holothuria leucospilota]
MEASELSFEEISTWTVASLKDYLRIRGLKQTGNKTKLIALVYGASQLGVQPKPNEVEEDRKRSEQYRKVLKICGKTLTDPLSELNDNWKGEKRVHCWPPVSYYEIAEWLLRDAPCESFFYLERIHFNESLWDEAVSSAKQFFSEYIVPELLTNKIRKEVQNQTVPYVPADSKHAEPPQTQDTVVSIAYEHNETPSSSNEGFIIDKGRENSKVEF